MSFKRSGKGPTYGEFSFPKSETTWVRGYARGGKVSQAKVHTVMHEFKEGSLHSGSKTGPKVKSRDQAVAIALNEGRKASRHAQGGPVQLPPKPNIPKPSDSKEVPKRPPLLGEQMGLPQKNFLGKDSRKYNTGGLVERSRMTMSPADVEKRKKSQGTNKGGPMMKVGGMVRQNKLKPEANVNLPPKSMNPKARLSTGVKSVENMKHGGKVKKMAKGGMAHPDAAEDKALIKKAVGMHDTQLHGGKHTNLTKLNRGGKVRG